MPILKHKEREVHVIYTPRRKNGKRNRQIIYAQQIWKKKIEKNSQTEKKFQTLKFKWDQINIRCMLNKSKTKKKNKNRKKILKQKKKEKL